VTAIRNSALRFAGVGVINSVLCILIIFGFKSLAGVGDVAANLTGYVVGLTCSFLLNRHWTFQHTDRFMPTLLGFLTVFLGSYLLNIVTVLILIHAGSNDYVAHLAGMPLYSVVFYVGCRYFVFRKPGTLGADRQSDAASRSGNRRDGTTSPRLTR
jgi:putative flippase GtrA